MPQASMTTVAGLRRPRKRANWAPERRCLSETRPIFSETATSRTDFATSTAMVVGFMQDSSLQVVYAPGDSGTTLPYVVAGGVHSITWSRRRPARSRQGTTRRRSHAAGEPCPRPSVPSRNLRMKLPGRMLMLVVASAPSIQEGGPAPKSDTVEVQSGALTLRGVLFRPPGAGPFPAVLFNHGAGPESDPS